MLLDVKHLKKTYAGSNASAQVQALKDVNFSVERGEYVAIMGESGSGKTTLLNLLAALDRPTAGTVLLEGKDLSELEDAQLSAFRRDHLGFVFQEFNLLDTFSLKDNILLPVILSGRRATEVKERLKRITGELGIGGILEKYPYEVSGGQKQRTAVARALMNNPELILADEPTGALDSGSSAELMCLLGKINQSGQTILMVTHSVDAASHAGRVLFIRDGMIFHQIYRGDCSNEELYRKITDTMTVLCSGRNAR